MKSVTTKNTILAILLGTSISATAQDSDSTSMRPTFTVSYNGEIQTDFKKSRQLNLLELGAELPISRNVSLNVATVSFATTHEEPLIEDLQGFSNIDSENVVLALSVAGVTWRINDHHTLFGGIRRIDEDYFCSDAIALFTNSSCGGFPTITANYDVAAYPNASLGVHYAYENDNLTVQASLYNGTGHNRFTGRDNIFRICPTSDGVMALGQVEYRHKDSHYYLGASMHHDDLGGTADRKVRPTAWTYAEQSLYDNLTLIAAYSHAFSSDNACKNFCGVGANYTLGKAQLGIFSDYTRVDGVNEWATELTANINLTEYLSVQPALHIVDTDNHTKCVGLLRLGISL